jgi:hypothetical protein
MMLPLSALSKNQPSRKNIVKERCGIIYDSIAIDLSCELDALIAPYNHIVCPLGGYFAV